MRQPRPTGAPIDSRRLKIWTDEFGAYRHAVTKATIESWLDQFATKDKDLAARVLDAVNFYSAQRIGSAFRNAIKSIPGWDKNPNRRRGRWFFVAYSGSAGESGDTMLHQFRLANGLDTKKDDQLFIYRSELISRNLDENDTVVFLDDLTATGDQVCRAWTEAFSELVAGAGRVYLLVVVAGPGAAARIKRDTEMRLVTSHHLSQFDSVFECHHFTDDEKATLLEYAKVASPKTPKGYGECGYLLVFQHRCPNNSLPILHAQNDKWIGLFPRHD